MRVTVTTKGNKVIARSGNRQKTSDASGDVSADHGRAVQAFVTKVSPGYRRAEILNSVKVEKTEPTKTVYLYKD
jgi:hypothetical protein